MLVFIFIKKKKKKIVLSFAPLRFESWFRPYWLVPLVVAVSLSPGSVLGLGASIVWTPSLLAFLDLVQLYIVTMSKTMPVRMPTTSETTLRFVSDSPSLLRN